MNDLEHAEQVKVIQWFELQYKKFRIFAIPNGGHRHISVAKKLKAEGVRSGVPDLFLPVPMHGLHGLFIEMKSEKGKVSDNQAEWCDYLEGQGYGVVTCYGFEQAMITIKAYLDKNTKL